MDWTNIISAVLAGGLSGQIVTLVWGDRLTKKREYNKWLVTERHKLYSELLAVITHTPKLQADLDKWTYEIRAISQGIHILFNDGTAPKELAQAMEDVFQLAQAKKDGVETKNWVSEMRTATRSLRKHMSSNIQAK